MVDIGGKNSITSNKKNYFWINITRFPGISPEWYFEFKVDAYSAVI
jgi:hypothetical protein